MAETTEYIDVIAIDGPAGAGKSTVARKVAQRLEWTYVDTGAMYRALCLKALREGVSVNDDEALTTLAQRTAITFAPSADGNRVLLDGEDITEEIRSPAVSEHVSEVAANAGARSQLSRLQREIALRGRAVLDGRDIGTHVVPEARLKIFLTADFEIRVERRHDELVRRGFTVSREAVAEGLASRDRIDSGRAVAPLRPADDALILDTTHLAIAQVVDRIVQEHLSVEESSL